MFCGPLPCASVKLLYYMHILEDILKIPSEIILPQEEEKLLKEAVNMTFISSFYINHKNTYLTLLRETGIIKENEHSDFLERIFFFCLTRPFENYKTKAKKEKDIMPLSSYIMKVSFVGTNEDNKVSFMFDKNFWTFMQLTNDYAKTNKIDRVKWGLFIRLCGYCHLKFFFVYGAAIDYRINSKIPENNLVEVIDIELYNYTYEKFAKVAIMLMEENLLHIDDLKPMLSGDEVADILGIKKGKGLGEIMNKCIEYQIDNPLIVRDELIKKLKNENDMK